MQIHSNQTIMWQQLDAKKASRNCQEFQLYRPNIKMRKKWDLGDLDWGVGATNCWSSGIEHIEFGRGQATTAVDHTRFHSCQQDYWMWFTAISVNSKNCWSHLDLISSQFWSLVWTTTEPLDQSLHVFMHPVAATWLCDYIFAFTIKWMWWCVSL